MFVECDAAGCNHNEVEIEGFRMYSDAALPWRNLILCAEFGAVPSVSLAM